MDPSALLRTIFQDAHDAIGISHHNVIRVVNPAMLRLFGLSREDEMVGRSFLEWMVPESAARLSAMAAQRAAGKAPPGMYRAQAVRADGQRFDVEIRTTTYTYGGEAYALALLRDIGSDLVAEAALRAQQDLYAAIFEANSAVKLLIDPSDGQIVDANPAAVELYGWSRETLRTMRISEINLLSPEEVAVELEAARAGRRQQFRFRHRTASGAIRHVEVHSGALEIGGRTLLLSILHDITERHALEGQLAQARELEAIGRVARGVAHDFNNLLTVVGTACESLARGLGPDDPSRAPLADILHAGRRAGELTSQLLAFGGQQVLETRAVQLNDIVSGVAPLLQRAVGRDVVLRLLLAPDLPGIAADPGQIEQVLLNLAINARDAMAGRGVLEISTEHDTLEQVAFRVRDTGHGMDAATRERIFEPFFTTKPRGQGTGLGLASAWGIVTQSGGRITVQSEPGCGAEFSVFLPISNGIPSSPPPRVERATVLLVNDDRPLRALLAIMLRGAGYRVLEAGSAEDAVAVRGPIQVLVTDVELPGRSGLELAHELKGRDPELAVVVVSGMAIPEPKLPDSAAFLQKPFSRDALLVHLRERLEAR